MYEKIYPDLYPVPNEQDMYAITQVQLQHFFSDLNDLDLSEWTPNLFTNFAQFVMGIRAYPIDFRTLYTYSKRNIRVGGRELPFTEGFLLRDDSMLILANTRDYIHIDLLNDADLKWMSYDPYVKAEIYLPYCGYMPIDVNAIMDKYLRVQYAVDILSGSCTAFVWAYDNIIESNARVVLRTEFQLAVDVPYSFDSAGVNERQSALAGIKGAISAITGGVVGVGAGLTGGVGGAIVGGIIGTAKGGASGLENWYKASAPSLQTGGSYSGSWAKTIEQYTPYVILAYKQPADYSADTFKKYRGTKVFEPVDDLTDCYGYTQIYDMHLEGLETATAEELDSIRNLLTSGIILPE